jgi:hypothetical protein
MRAWGAHAGEGEAFHMIGFVHPTKIGRRGGGVKKPQLGFHIHVDAQTQHFTDWLMLRKTLHSPRHSREGGNPGGLRTLIFVPVSTANRPGFPPSWE